MRRCWLGARLGSRARHDSLTFVFMVSSCCTITDEVLLRYSDEGDADSQKCSMAARPLAMTRSWTSAGGIPKRVDHRGAHDGVGGRRQGV